MKYFFIKKNETEILDKLHKMGYTICPCCYHIDSVYTMIYTHENIVHGKCPLDNDNKGIDCGNDELKFFELAEKNTCLDIDILFDTTIK